MLVQESRRTFVQPTGATLVFDAVRSTVLEGNPLGDPEVRELVVYLPPGYDPAGDRPYPVIYCLTGFTGAGYQLVNRSIWGEGLHERLDRLLAAGAIQPTIVVMPDCATRLGGSQYLNSTATGRYEDYLIEEIVPYIDASFHTAPVASARAVMGKSSGGYGALIHAMRHPQLFGLAACHSGDLYFDYCYRTEFPKLVNAVWRHGGVTAFVEQFEAQVKKSGQDIGALNILAMAACYSPDPSAELGIALPFDSETGIVVEGVWQRWLAWDPLVVAEQSIAALRALRLLFFDCGLRDEFHLHVGARELHRRLTRLDVNHEYEEFDDTHMQISYRFDASLPRLSAAFQY